MSLLKLNLAICTFLTFYSALTVSVTSLTGQFKIKNDCTCEGYEQIYECRVTGEGGTIWKGSAFNCTQNEITLLHPSSADNLSESGTCNNGAIVGRLVEVENHSSYISQLSVSVSSNMIGSNISCLHEIPRSTMVDMINTFWVYTTTEPYPPPNDLQIVDANSTHLTFQWSPVPYNCLAIKYNITSDNCGVCPNVTNNTTATCQWSFTEEQLCTFSLQTVVCDDISGNASKEVSLTLRVPDAPSVNDIIPTYSNETRKLLVIKTRFNEEAIFNISKRIDGSPVSYTIKYSDPASPLKICNSTTIPASSCVNGRCEHDLDVPSTSCSSLSHISVTVSATNRLGSGPSSNLSSVLETINEYVNITFDTVSKTIICVFHGGQRNSRKSCSIAYGLHSAGEMECQSVLPPRIVSNTNITNLVYIKLFNEDVDFQTPRKYCFTATADNGMHTVIVKGSLVVLTFNMRTGFERLSLTVGITAAFGCSVGALILVIVILTVIFASIIAMLMKSRKELGVETQRIKAEVNGDQSAIYEEVNHVMSNPAYPTIVTEQNAAYASVSQNVARK